MSFASILSRVRTIHKVNLAKISMIAALPSASSTNFDNDEGSCILAAFSQYTTDKPRRRVLQVTSPSSLTWKYNLDTLIAGWNDSFKIERIQYPLPTSPPNVNGEFFMDSNDWRETIDPADESFTLLFNRNRPTSAFAIWYFRPHTFDPSTNTSSIPSADEEAFAQLAASYVLDLAANLSAGFSDKSTFENKDLGNQSARYESRAKAAKDRYDELIFKSTPDFTPTWVDWDNDPPGGYERPFHPAEWY